MQEAQKTQNLKSVFVHLGATLPEHLRLNLLRHLELFPGQSLTLIVDQDLDKRLPKEIEVYRFEVPKDDEEMLNRMELVSDFYFRSGFWKYTFLRLFALDEFHKTCPLVAILHIESDVILMENFPWQKFKSLNKLAWLGVNNLCDVASLVFSPNSDETNFLMSQIRKIAQDDPNTTDMYSLRQFVVKNPTRHIYLPSLTMENSRIPDKFDSSAMEQLSYFQGYFDPSAIGMWNFGQDPKNRYGIRSRYYIDKSYDLDPSKSKYFYENGRLLDSGGLNLFSLHIHSKYLPLFGHKWQKAIAREIEEARNNSKLVSFSFKAFLGAITDRKPKDNLWLLIANIPGVNFFRRFAVIENAKEFIKKLLKIRM